MQDVKLGETGSNIDILDFEPFLDGTGKQAVADAILASFKKIGFVYLTNHGISQTKIDEMFAWVSYRCLMIGRRLNLITHDHAVQTFL